jgi:hypothetical protein
MEYINPYYITEAITVQFVDAEWQEKPEYEQHTALVKNKGGDFSVNVNGVAKAVGSGEEFILTPKFGTYSKIAEKIELDTNYTITKDGEDYFIKTSSVANQVALNPDEVANVPNNGVSPNILYQNQQIGASVEKKRDSIESQQAIKIAIDLILADKLNLEAKMTKEQSDTLAGHVKTILSIINNSYDIEAAAPAPPPHTDNDVLFD